MTRKKALIVRGGWEGHRPVEATELFLPVPREQRLHVRIEESTEVYADAAEMAATDLVVQCVTMSEITAEQVVGTARGGRGRHRLHRLARRHRRLVPRLLRLPAAGRRPVRHPPGQGAVRAAGRARRTTSCRTRSTITELGREHPITAGIEDFDAAHRAVLGAARRPDRRAGHDHPPGPPVAALAPAGHLARRSGPGSGAPGGSW